MISELEVTLPWFVFDLIGESTPIYDRLVTETWLRMLPLDKLGAA